MLSIKEALAKSSELLAQGGVLDPVLDAELLAAHVRGESLGELRVATVLEKELTAAQWQRMQDYVAQRKDRVPLQHLTGKAPFRSIELDVGPGVFIPRPETEIVTQFVVDELLAVPTPQPLVIDFCAGSAAISLAVATEVPHARVWAVELEENAHAWATKNIARLGDDRVTLLRADATKANPVLEKLNGLVSVVVSNPPYVPAGAIPVDAEVRDHDPHAALYSGEDGLNVIRALSKVAKPLLAPGGLFVLEHAELQGAAVREILTAAGWQNASTHQDLTRRDRVTIARA